MEKVRIAILDSTDNVLAFMDNSAPGNLHFKNDTLHNYLRGSASTFEFETTARHEDSVYLTVGNKLAFAYKGRSYYLNIMKAIKNEYTITVTAYSYMLELVNEKRPAEKYTSLTFVQYLNKLSTDNVLNIGVNEVSSAKKTIEWTGEDTILNRLYSLATSFDAELEFVTELNSNYSLKRLVLNVYRENSSTTHGLGEDRTDEILRYAKNISGITKTEDITSLYTAIKPIGTDKLSISKIEKTVTDANGKTLYYTKSGSPYIYAPQSRDRFPSNLMESNGRYIAVTWSYDTKNADTLYSRALTELKKNCVPLVSYEVEGYVDANIGDTFMIQDEEYNPPLYLSARVTEQEISFTDSTYNKTIFDNFKEKQSAISQDLISKMNSLIDEAKLSEYSLVINSSNGVVVGGTFSTTLTARIFQNGIEQSYPDLVSNGIQIAWYEGTDFSTKYATGNTLSLANPSTMTWTAMLETVEE